MAELMGKKIRHQCEDQTSNKSSSNSGKKESEGNGHLRGQVLNSGSGQEDKEPQARVGGG